MTTKAKVKTITFTVSAKFGFYWKPVASYEASKASLPQSITAFQKWFNGWRLPNVEYRIDATDENGVTVWQWSHIPGLD